MLSRVPATIRDRLAFYHSMPATLMLRRALARSASLPTAATARMPTKVSTARTAGTLRARRPRSVTTILLGVAAS